MITFYFLRHGIKKSVPFDPPLTEVGMKQAELTAEYLKTIPFKTIVASPKLRTRQTAKATAGKIGLQIVLDERLQERLEWEHGKSLEEFFEEWWKTDRDRKYQPKKGESSYNKGVQMRQVLDEFSKKHTEGNILFVTHGGSIGDLLRNLFIEEDIPLYKTDPKSGTRYIELLECSLTVVQLEGDKYKLLRINDTSHLSK